MPPLSSLSQELDSTEPNLAFASLSQFQPQCAKVANLSVVDTGTPRGESGTQMSWMSCDFQKLILASAAFVRVVDTAATHTDEKGEQGFSLSSPALACKHNKKGEMAQQMKLQIHNEYPYKNTTNTIKGGLITTLLLSRGLAYPTE